MDNINLKAIRTEVGYTQRELARLLGIKQQQYSRYENGTNKIPLETFLKMLEICECKFLIQMKNGKYDFIKL